MSAPLPISVEATLLQPITNVSIAISEFLQLSAAAIARRQTPPLLTQLDADFSRQSEALTAMRQQGLARQLPDDDLARIFGLAFALEQLRRDLEDLTERGAELAGQPNRSNRPNQE